MALLVAETTDKLKKSPGSSLSGVYNAYQTQLSRLASFSLWPYFGKLSALAFSSTGFYYTGHGDEVACFSCGLRLGQWTAGMLPADAHTELSGGRCAFLAENHNSCKVALGTQPDSASRLPNVGEVSDNMATQYRSMTLSESSTAVSSVIYGGAGHGQSSASSAKPRQHCDVDAVKREAYRLSTYANVWQSSNIVTPKELAAAGFYYAGVAIKQLQSYSS